MPLRALNYQSPLETLKGQNTYTVPPKVFGCVCFVHIKDAGKLDPRALRCVFIGYSPTQKGSIGGFISLGRKQVREYQ